MISSIAMVSAVGRPDIYPKNRGEPAISLFRLIFVGLPRGGSV